MSNFDEFQYVGEELELFRDVTIWKNYFARHIIPYIKGDTLEVGAGLGGTTPYIRPKNNITAWTCLEPDFNMSETIKDKIKSGELPDDTKALNCVVKELNASNKFDSILYIDVLEHIEDDFSEIENAMKHLAPGGKVVIVCPAHNWLYTPFDKAIGHYRRYNKISLRKSIPKGLIEEKLFYLDSIGLFASLANRLLLKQSIPTKSQLQIWDKFLVPLSKIFDKCFFYLFGKQIVGVWRLSDEASSMK